MLDPQYDFSSRLDVVDFCRRHAGLLRLSAVTSPGLAIGFWVMTTNMDPGLLFQLARYNVAASLVCGPLCGLVFALCAEREASWDERVIEFLLLVAASVIVAVPVAGISIVCQFMLVTAEQAL